MSWTDAKLEDLVLLQRGFDITKAEQREGQIPVISSSGVQSYHNVAKVKGPGVIVGRKGSVGTVYFCETDYWPHDTTLWSKDLKGNDAKFVAYFLRTQNLNRFDTGNSNPTLNRNHIHGQPIKKPDLPTQQRIAGILSAYDDLIENNRRRIGLLEQAARLLYREWFVHFRFPGHETAKFVDGLPEGWREVTISDLADVFRGKSYKSSELGDEVGKPFINLKCFERGGGFRVSGLKWFTGEHKEQHIAKIGDIVIAVTDLTRDAAVVAQAARVPRTVGANAVYSMDLVKAVPKPATNPIWFYGLLRFSRFSAEVKEEASGATVLHLKPKHIEKWKLPKPPQEICDLFAQQFGPILQQVDSLESQNDALTRARDLLLPRLMDGRITV